MRFPNTTGVERLPIGTRQARPSPVGSFSDGGVHFVGRPVSAERPSRFGPPRHSGQLSADGTAVRTAKISAVAPPRTASGWRDVTDVRVAGMRIDGWRIR